MPRVNPQLPCELIQSEVLPRLATKSVCRLRCVCKAWNSFLSTPTFTRMHLRYHTNYKLIVFDPRSHSYRTLDCEPVNHDSLVTHPTPFEGYVAILASLDGLLCVGLHKTRELAFWNPLTGAYKKFGTHFYNDITNGAFAFYKDSSNDYKLLHIVTDSSFIYSRRLDSWRKIPSLESHSDCTSNFFWWPVVFFMGKVYFKLTHRKHVRYERKSISFDVENEKFKEMQYPTIPNYGGRFGDCLVVLNGCINLCVAYGYFDNVTCGIWRIDGDGWIKVATYPRARVNLSNTRQIHIRSNGNWLAIGEDNTNTFKNIDMEDFITDWFVDCTLSMFHEDIGAIYVETLMSPNP